MRQAKRTCTDIYFGNSQILAKRAHADSRCLLLTYQNYFVRLASGSFCMREEVPILFAAYMTSFGTDNVWMLQKALRPSTPPSTPEPDCLTPPKGISGAASMCVFTHTLPASSCRPMRSPWSRSFVQTDAPSPISVLLARRITSSSEDQGMMGRMGPA